MKYAKHTVGCGTCRQGLGDAGDGFPIGSCNAAPSRADERGVIALLTMIVLGALVVSIGIAAGLVGHSQLVVEAVTDHERQVRALASTCLEEAVYRVKLDPAYAGGTVPLEGETCAVTVSGAGGTRTVTATAAVASHTKSLTATLTLKQNAALSARAWSVTAWQEGNPP
ncbi:MAG TPA: hypothetical protein VLC10_04825 [Patescibacteria group bacterium]|nr:hypothetical protein [Patescibacteria group bacterium]